MIICLLLKILGKYGKNISEILSGWVFLKVYDHLSFAKNMSKNIGKNISEILSGR